MRTVSQVARAAGVSVRALHHYDAIGLLKPAHVGANGYRLYDRRDLLKLQQILIYRELGLPLFEIKAIVESSTFEALPMLRQHRARLLTRLDQVRGLLQTIERTINSIERNEAMEDTDLFTGISHETRARWEAEATAAHGETVVLSATSRLRALAPAQASKFKAEMLAIRREYQQLFATGASPTSDAAQAVTARHFRWVCHSWTPSAAAFKGLGQLYIDNPEFRAMYEDGALPGTAAFIAEAMSAYADRSL